MNVRMLRPVVMSLVVAAGLLAAIPANAEDDTAYDVVIEIDDQSVTYNGDTVDGLATLEEDLVADIEADPELRVKLLAHDTVPAEYVIQIMDVIRQYEIECTFEMISSGAGQDDNM